MGTPLCPNTQQPPEWKDQRASSGETTGYGEFEQVNGAVVNRINAENKRLRKALFDAIKKPMGVVPFSAEEFLST